MYFDILTREVNSYIFVPSVIAGSIGSYLLGMPSVVVISWVAVFACTFLPPDNYVYPLAGGLFVITAVLLFLSSALILFDSIIIAILYFLGTREKYFGIADVKALMAGAISFPFALGFGYPVFQLISNMVIPVPFLLILNSSVAGLLFIPYLIILNFRKKNSRGIYWTYALGYNRDEYNRNPFKYRVSDYNGRRIMVYKSPFMVAIFASVAAAVIFGI